MNKRTIAAVALSVSATAILAIQIVSWPASARFGFSLSAISRCSPSIASLSDYDQAQGLRLGDQLQLPAMNFEARLPAVYQYLPVQTARAGETVTMVVKRAGRQLENPYLPRHADSLLTFLAQLGFKLFLLALGLLLLWRGRDRASLVLGIWCLEILVCLPDAWWGSLPAVGRLVGGVLSVGSWTFAPFVLYLVIESLAPSLSPRTKLTARAIVAATLVPALFENTVNAAAQASAGCSLVLLPQWLINDSFVATQLAIMAFFILYYLRSAGLQRQRLRWVFWAFLISRFGVLLNLFNRIVAHPVHLSGVEWLTVMIFPLGCAYAILRHRIIDVNFVLNRALIYTVLTTIAVGVFILLESLMGSLAVTRGASLAAEFVVALSLGFSFNALHRRVEVGIDRVLFRRKYQAAKELQQLADEAGYMENPDALLHRAVREIPGAIEATGAVVYERAADGYQATVSSGNLDLPNHVAADDLAFVRLRMKAADVHLSDVNSALGQHGICFPFSIRGELFGAFICGARLDGESFAPDEVRMLSRITHEIGSELFAMRTRRHQELLESVLSGSIDINVAQQHFQATAWPRAR